MIIESESTLQSASVLVAIVGGLVTAGTALWQMHANRRQRIKELRWRQASEGRKLIDEMNGDRLAAAAMRMLDWQGRKFKSEEGVEEAIAEKDVLWGLRTGDFDAASPEGRTDDHGGMSPKDEIVRDSFDSFFFHIHRIEQAIRNDLTTFDDVRFPLDYYGKKMRDHSRVYATFMYEYGYKLAAKLYTDRLGLPFQDPRPQPPPAADAERRALN